MSSEKLYHQGNDEYETPDWIKVGLFGDWFDPCPFGGSDFDGLAIEWKERNFVNPPYSKDKIRLWVRKAIAEYQKGKTVVMLVKFDSSTEWWHLLQEAGAYFVTFFKRVYFSNQKHTPFCSVLAVLYPERTDSLQSKLVEDTDDGCWVCRFPFSEHEPQDFVGCLRIAGQVLKQAGLKYARPGAA